jgi:hypothetical protein
MPRASGAGRSDENDPDCVKTPRGITAPGILGSMVMRRTKKRKNLSSARHHDQIRFRFHTTKTRLRHSRSGRKVPLLGRCLHLLPNDNNATFSTVYRALVGRRYNRQNIPIQFVKAD